MKKIKILFEQAILISVGIIICMSIEATVYHLLGDDIALRWYHPLSILLTGICCAFPSLILFNSDSSNSSNFMVRIIIHAALLYVMVIGFGYIFNWYKEIDGFIFLSCSFLLVYAFVWVSQSWLSKKDENEINSALNEIRDEE